MRFYLSVNTFWSIVVILIISLATISVWFKDGKLLATGEEGLVLANPTQSIKLYQSAWNEVGTGISVPGVNPMIPYFYFEEYLMQIGLQIWQIQGLTFFLLMSIGAIFCYLLAKEILPIPQKDLARISFLAAFFYLFNPISMLGVWYRFALSFMTFYALIPLFLYLYIYGLKNKKISFVIILPLLSLLFSFAFSAPSSVLLLWLLPFVYSLTFSLNRSNGSWRISYFPVIYLLLTGCYWILVNLWWLIPFVELSKLAFSSETGIEHAVGTLKANSQDFGLNNVIRLIHGGFLYRGEAFGSVYQNPLFIILSWMIPLFTFFGLLKFKIGKLKKFFTSSLLLLLFLAKGTSFPFGFLFLFLFTHITILQLYRNPLEKIGMLLPIIYAPLFALGLYHLQQKIGNWQLRTLLHLISLIGIFIFHWPFFSGAMVVYGNRDIRVEVPSSFREANIVLSDSDHIIYSLPGMGGASGRYTWEYGYAGVESSEYLFKDPVITKFYDAKSFLGQILIAESHSKLNNNLLELTQLFSADIVAHRKDTDLQAFGYNLDGHQRSEMMIGEAKLKNIFDSKEVSLWSLPEDESTSVIYTPNRVVKGESADELVKLIVDDKYNPQIDTYICTDPKQCIPFVTIPGFVLDSTNLTPPKINFHKISPTNYQINIDSAQDKFLLVFNKSFHPGWDMVIDNQLITKDNHFIANGYANGFIVEKQGSFKANLIYSPDYKFKQSREISFYSGIAGLLLLVVLKVFKPKFLTLNN